jgi:hypothetical protein
MRKAYIRYNEELPASTMLASAQQGLHDRGVHTTPFYGFGDIESLSDLGPDVGLVGFVNDVHQALAKINRPAPPTIDYPPVLQSWLHRSVTKTTLGDVLSRNDRFFVKPVSEKLFTGFIWPTYIQRVCGLPEDTELLISDVVDFKSEYRTFVLDGRILDCRRYKGDWSLALDKNLTLEAVEAMTSWESCPRAYCLDLGVIDTSRCCLVEVNDAYSFGNYGLNDCLYAQMLEARWDELAIDRR